MTQPEFPNQDLGLTTLPRRLSMRRSLALILVLVTIGHSFAQADDGFQSLFDGKTLDGWTQKNGTATYRVEDGCVVGKTSEGSPNSFLCTEKDYGDFELHFMVKVDDALNSGVQIRSQSKADRDNGRVHGPQVEIAINGTAGYIYGEALGTGWLSGNGGNPEPHKNFKNGQWNNYKVIAKGESIQTWVNGVQVADLVDKKSMMPRGFIGLQVHGIGQGTGPYEVRWKNIKIRELK